MLPCCMLYSQDHYNVHLNTFQCGGCKKSFGRRRYLEQHGKTCPAGSAATATAATDSTADRSAELQRRQQQQLLQTRLEAAREETHPSPPSGPAASASQSTGTAFIVSSGGQVENAHQLEPSAAAEGEGGGEDQKQFQVSLLL